ncbi:MAG: hypothetical protein WCV62_02360 [Candidatus Peribacteraceae bacterium]
MSGSSYHFRTLVVHMRDSMLLFVIAITLTIIAVPTAFAISQRRLTVGTQPQLFVDDALISEMSGAELILHHPVPAEVAIKFDAPWEGDLSTFVTVMYDQGIYRMYYNGDDDSHEPVTCYAESKDGIHWVKLQLGLFAFNGSSKNNIIWMGNDQTLETRKISRYPTFNNTRPKNKQYWILQNGDKVNVPANFSPFRDTNPRAKSSEIYKAIGGMPPMALGSPDGIHWHFLKDTRVMEGEDYDSMNTALYDPRIKRYVAYVRSNKYPGRAGIRSIVRRTSSDFLHWGSGTVIDEQGSPVEQLYTNAITPYFRLPAIFIGLPMRIVEERKAVQDARFGGITDAVFMSSRDGIHFNRQFLDAFIRPGTDIENWMHGSIMPAKGIVPTGPDEISIYYTEHFGYSTNRLRRATLRTDGFVSVHASYMVGSMTTKTFVFTGSNLVINASTSVAGSIRVEVIDVSVEPQKANSLLQSKPFYGDAIDHTVLWTGSGVNLGALAGRPIRLKFVLRDADLYSFHFEQ